MKAYNALPKLIRFVLVNSLIGVAIGWHFR